MHVVGLVSGGKDSCYNMLECVRAGHQIVALAHLYPPDGGELDSFMYQTVGSEAVSLYAEAMGLPLFTRPILGASADTGSADSYRSSGNSDEVEDLYNLLADVKSALPEVSAVSVGAILSNYQRVRVESVCARLGLEVLAFLWRRNQVELLDEMLSSGLDAIIVKVAAFGLTPQCHLGRHLTDIRDKLVALAASPTTGLNACGEGGEYETLTLDCPALFRHGRLVVDSSQMVVHSDDAFAPVCYLRLEGCRLETRHSETEAEADASLRPIDRLSHEVIVREFAEDSQDEFIRDPDGKFCAATFSVPPPFFVINLMVSSAHGEAATTATQLAVTLMARAAEALKGPALRPLLCVLQVPDMTAFAAVNTVYSECFAALAATASPPARACVEVPSSDTQMSLSILAVPASQSEPSFVVEAMHVRSRSHWAPANIGPYSQCCCLRLMPNGDRLLAVSGQIGMDPATLEVPPGTSASYQAELSLRHVLRVARANGLSAAHSQSVLSKLIRNGRLLTVCFCVDVASATAGLEAFHRLACRRRCCEEGAAGCPDCRRAVVPALCSRLPKGASVEWLTFLVVGGDSGNGSYGSEEAGCGVDYLANLVEVRELLATNGKVATTAGVVSLCLVNETAATSAEGFAQTDDFFMSACGYHMVIRCAGFPGRSVETAAEPVAAVAWIKLQAA